MYEYYFCSALDLRGFQIFKDKMSLGLARGVWADKDLSGLRSLLVEFIAGRHHFTHYRDFTRRGGLPVLLSNSDVALLSARSLDKGNKQAYEVAAQIPQLSEGNTQTPPGQGTGI